MAGDQLHRANGVRRDVFPPSIRPQPGRNHALQNVRILPAANIGQPEDHWQDIAQPVGGLAEPGRPQDPYHLNVAYQSMVEYHPLMPGEPVDAPYVFPNAELAQGIPDQRLGQANAPENRDHGSFGYAPQHVAPGPAHLAFRNSFIHYEGPPTPDQLSENNLQQLASRYLYHPNSRINTVCMERGATGRFQVVIILEASDVL